MVKGRIVFTVVFVVSLWYAHTGRRKRRNPQPTPALHPGPILLDHSSELAPKASPPAIVSLTVSRARHYKWPSIRKSRYRTVGQQIHGRHGGADLCVRQTRIPVGTKVTGKITEISRCLERTANARALDADFTPRENRRSSSKRFALPDGTSHPSPYVVTPGSGKIQFVTAAAPAATKGVKSIAAEKTKQAKLQAKRNGKLR